MESNLPTDLITVTEARRLLGVSRIKIAELIREKVIRSFPYPLDRRVKLVSKAELLGLKNTRLSEADDDKATHNYNESKAAA